MAEPITLFLCGDVMTGRGIDQILAYPSDPVLYESYVKDARGYVGLAEARHGALAVPVSDAYIWGDALSELDTAAPDLRIVNLETSITSAGTPWLGKGIHYRMHPRNIGALAAAGLDAGVLANNHVLDWGHDGLRETLEALEVVGIAHPGAGLDPVEAAAPARLPTAGKGGVLLFAVGAQSSGIPPTWAAGAQPGVNLLPDLGTASADHLADQIQAFKQPGDVVVLSIHWGGNWGYRIPPEHQAFAHRLIDAGGADLVHGHSSHHPLAVEVYRNRLILYGCGDFLNDYEGIRGYEAFRSDLALMYFPSLEPGSGELRALRMQPMQIHRLRARYPQPDDARWLCGLLCREGRRFGTGTELSEDGCLQLRW